MHAPGEEDVAVTHDNKRVKQKKKQKKKKKKKRTEYKHLEES